MRTGREPGAHGVWTSGLHSYQPLASAPPALMTGTLCQTTPSIHVEAHVVSFSKRDATLGGACVRVTIYKKTKAHSFQLKYLLQFYR